MWEVCHAFCQGRLYLIQLDTISIENIIRNQNTGRRKKRRGVTSTRKTKGTSEHHVGLFDGNNDCDGLILLWTVDTSTRSIVAQANYLEQKGGRDHGTLTDFITKRTVAE